MRKTLAALVAVLLAASPAAALEWMPLGSRSLGMGGTGVASVEGPMANYWNPAALGRRTMNDSGVQVPFTVHAAFDGSVLEGAKDLNAIQDGDCGGAPCTQQQVIDALNKLNHPDEGVRVGAGLGADLRVGRVGVFLNNFATAGAMPRPDLTPANTTPTAIQNGTNNSRLVVKGAQISELGAGYGGELPFAPGLFLGGNLKVIGAKVGYTSYSIFRDENDGNDVFDRLKDNAQSSGNLGVDAGVLWDVARSFESAPLDPRVGLVARNINNPRFKLPAAALADGYVGKYAVNPQARLGVSLSPLSWWRLAADADLTRNLTSIDGKASRQVGVGTEVNLFNQSWINLPLRAGLSRNVADKTSGTMLTLGAGLHLAHVFLDVSAAASGKRARTRSVGDDEEVPREAALALQLGVLFGGPSKAERRRVERSSPGADEPVSTERVRQNAEKAQQELDKQSPTYAPAGN